LLGKISQNAEYGLPNEAHMDLSTPERGHHVGEVDISHQEIGPLQRQGDRPSAKARHQEKDESLTPSVPFPIVRRDDPSGTYRKWGVDKNGNDVTLFTPDPMREEEEEQIQPANSSRSFTIRGDGGVSRLWS
jgi:hypothetical protein